jgi:lipopolysaccharide export system permease protein
MVRVDRVLPEEKRMTGITVFEREGPVVRRRLNAEEAVWTGRGWELHRVRAIAFPESGPWQESSSETLSYPLAPPLEEITVSQGKAEEWNMAELGKRIRSHRAQGLSVTSLEVDLWSKTSLPFTCFLLPLLAIPFSLGSSRRTGLWGGVAVGIIIGLVYMLVLLFGISLGRTGVMPPWLAAWAGNFVFIALTVYLFRRAEWGR